MRWSLNLFTGHHTYQKEGVLRARALGPLGVRGSLRGVPCGEQLVWGALSFDLYLYCFHSKFMLPFQKKLSFYLVVTTKISVFIW